MVRPLLFGLLFCACSGQVFASTLINGDSIGPDNSLTNNLGGFGAGRSGADNFGEPAIEVTQSGTTLLDELRVIVFGTPAVNGNLDFGGFNYVARLWRKSNYLSGADAEREVILGDPYNVSLVQLDPLTTVPSPQFGDAAFTGPEIPSYDFRFDLSQATLIGSGTPAFDAPLAADTWIVAFQSAHTLTFGALGMSLSSSTSGSVPYFSQAFTGMVQHPRGILFDQDPIEFRWGFNLSETSAYADFDDDNDIDGFDFLKWQRGETPEMGSADELALWESQYGDTVPPLSALVASIPEPSTLLLSCLAGCVLLQRRRRVSVRRRAHPRYFP